MKNVTLWLIITFSAFTNSATGELFEYQFSGEAELEDISCKFSNLSEVDYEKVNTYSFSVILFGDTDLVQRTAITGYGDLDTIELIDGVLLIDEVGFLQLNRSKIRSLNQTGRLGFSWGATETSIGKSILFHGSSRLLYEEATNDSVYFDSVISFNPTFTLSNRRTYKILSSNSAFYSARPVATTSDVVPNEDSDSQNPCFPDVGIDPTPFPDPTPINPPIELVPDDSSPVDNTGGSGGSFKLADAILLLVLLFLRLSVITNTVSRKNLRCAAGFLCCRRYVNRMASYED